MILDYLILFLRFINRSKSYFFINIFGLAIAISCAILLFDYISFHTSFDNFHNGAERIVRVTTDSKFGNEALHEASSMPPLAKALQEDFPEVEATVRLFDPNLLDNAILVSRGESSFKENEILYTDSTFFDVFSFKLKDGSPTQCLTKPHSVVLTHASKQKYFGDNQAMGEQLILNDKTYVVTGIAENPPLNSHIKFDFLASLNSLTSPRQDVWMNTPFYTYVRLKEKEDILRLQSKLEKFIDRHVTSDLEKYFNTTYADLKKSGGKYDLMLQPIIDIHLHSNLSSELTPNENFGRISILGIIALFIIIIASINFINLTTALSSQRAKEIGVKKIFGGTRIDLIVQFLVESILYALFAAVIGLALAFTLVPYFSDLLDHQITLKSLITIDHLVVLFLFTISLGVASGIYPAIIMSSFRPATILKGSIRSGFKSKGLRNSLVIIQFSISIFLIACSVIFYNQMNYMIKKDLGFNKEQVVVLENISKLGTSLDAMKTELGKIPEVISTTASRELPSGKFQILISTPEGSDKSKTFAYFLADENFLETFGLQLLEGRNFTPGFSSDSSGAVLINESLKKDLELQDPLGRAIDTRMNYPIIGVIKDFNFETLRNKIQPLAIFYQKDGSSMDFLSVRYSSRNLPELIGKLEVSWKKIAGNIPFEFDFLDDRVANLYRQEKIFYEITMVFTVISILISSMGFIGLITFAIKMKEKEISIRKVLGSSIIEIQLIFAKDLISLMIVSTIIAVPTSIWFINNWLDAFSYRTNLDPMIFVFATFSMFFITTVAVIYFTLKAAFVNPIQYLRDN